MRDFVGAVSEAGCRVFLVHARNAWLKGLSPKENREVPPLRYDMVHRLKRDFPQLVIAVNGGITTDDAGAEQLDAVDGVMVGREAYHNPWWLAEWDSRSSASATAELTREEVEERDDRIHGARSAPTRHALEQHRAPHAGPAQRPAGRAPLAPGLERPPIETPAAGRGDGAGARRHPPRHRAGRPDSRERDS